jgi:CDP-glucose 4,6-dehydratase
VENLGMNPEFWKGRRVFVTGHTGFKGSWLALLLQMLGAEVHGFALTPTTIPALFTDAKVASGMNSRFGDIRDQAFLATSVRDAAPEIVLHLAAQAIVSESFDKPLDTLQTNIIGTANLLEALRAQKSVKAVLIVTSDKCYENKEGGRAYREDEPLGGNDPYSASKACTELVAASWRYAFFDKPGQPVIATARAGNVIGGGDWSRDRLVPDIMRAFIKQESAQLRSPDSIRPWQHVLEPVLGYLSIAERCFADRSFGQAWNFGPSEADVKPVRHVADRLAQFWGDGAGWTQQGNNPVKEARILKLDSTKAQNLLPWRPRTTLDDGLRLTAQWYRGYAAGNDVRRLTEAQIYDFLARSSA